MNTSTADISQILDQVARLQVPAEALHGADLDSIISDFGLSFQDLQNSAPDSAALQATITRLVRQLIVFSVMQSQQLQRQQEMLETHQNALSTAQKQFRHQQGTLVDKAQALERHNKELQQLTMDLIEVKDNHTSAVQRLQDMAQELRTAREDLQGQLQESMSDVTNRVDTACEWFQTVADAQHAKVEALRTDVQADADARDQAERLLADDLSVLQKQLDQKRTDIEALTADLQKSNARIGKLNTGLIFSVLLALGGLGVSVASHLKLI